MTAPATFSVDDSGIGWVILDQPGSRANVVTADFLAALDALLARVAPAAKAVVFISAKERVFLAGADLHWIETLPDAQAASEVSASGQRVFQGIAALPIPTVCAIHGACAGGGLEFALACDWRIVTDSPTTRLGFPEVSLGTIPGWGGCARLPRLIGGEAALALILEARLLAAAAAREAGLVDQLVPAGALRSCARAAAVRLIENGKPKGTCRPQSFCPRPVPPAPTENCFQRARADLLAQGKVRGHEPAPFAAVDTIEAGALRGLADALEIEAEAFGRLTAGEGCKNRIYGFLLREAARRRTLRGWFPEEPPARAIRKVGVVGAGVMGSGIAHWLASHEYPVILHDADPDAALRAVTRVRRLLDEGAHRKKLTSEARDASVNRVAATTELSDFRDCDLVIEAIFEDLGAKRSLFAALAKMVRPDAVLASNTSALPIEEIAAGISHPERALGIHFFNPVSRMPLVELIVGSSTGSPAAHQALALIAALGKQPVICRSSPGLLVTRILFFYLNAALKLWEDGAGTAAIDAALRTYGWPMGPLRLIDEVGFDVTDAILRELEHYFPSRMDRSGVCERLLAAGLKGRKSGRGTGFYTYREGGESVNGAIAFNPMDARPATPGDPDPNRIVERLMGVMVEEAGTCLAEGVVKSADDIDFALLAGAGFPPFRGGLMRWAATVSSCQP